MQTFFRNLFIMAAGAALLASFNVLAQGNTARDKEIAERFAKCDTNRDGKLTLNEAKGCMPRIYDNFSMIDVQGRGYVTVAEIQAMANR
jgi:Ca2+-binding EF-hand superfamily protein